MNTPVIGIVELGYVGLPLAAEFGKIYLNWYREQFRKRY